ncbi:hypothetical protein H5410_035806 [Solanum commersonii]|uniref:Uncharacterized protein n=1 Tax=Solanum commersonii TaxID=4109 RepID=A0A9J5Y698_SOLCO|nr:hypothetical protein H5410_035806 [Solanum commersonii]
MNSYDLPIQGYQGKAPHYARPSYHGGHPLMQVQATQRRVLLLNPRYHDMVCGLTKSSYHAKHSIVLSSK